MARAECRACGKIFSSTYAFDKHRTGSYGKPIREKNRIIGYTKHKRRCCTEQEMLDKQMIKNDKGVWTTGEFDASIFVKQGGETSDTRANASEG